MKLMKKLFGGSDDTRFAQGTVVRDFIQDQQLQDVHHSHSTNKTNYHFTIDDDGGWYQHGTYHVKWTTGSTISAGEHGSSMDITDLSVDQMANSPVEGWTYHAGTQTFTHTLSRRRIHFDDKRQQITATLDVWTGYGGDGTVEVTYSLESGCVHFAYTPAFHQTVCAVYPANLFLTKRLTVALEFMVSRLWGNTEVAFTT